MSEDPAHQLPQIPSPRQRCTSPSPRVAALLLRRRRLVSASPCPLACVVLLSRVVEPKLAFLARSRRIVGTAALSSRRGRQRTLALLVALDLEGGVLVLDAVVPDAAGTPPPLRVPRCLPPGRPRNRAPHTWSEVPWTRTARPRSLPRAQEERLERLQMCSPGRWCCRCSPAAAFASHRFGSDPLLASASSHARPLPAARVSAASNSGAHTLLHGRGRPPRPAHGRARRRLLRCGAGQRPPPPRLLARVSTPVPMAVSTGDRKPSQGCRRRGAERAHGVPNFFRLLLLCPWRPGEGSWQICPHQVNDSTSV